MKFGEMTIHFLITFVITFATAAIVSFLYSLIVHGSDVVDWETSFRLAITLGVILTWMAARQWKGEEKW